MTRDYSPREGSAVGWEIIKGLKITVIEVLSSRVGPDKNHTLSHTH